MRGKGEESCNIWLIFISKVWRLLIKHCFCKCLKAYVMYNQFESWKPTICLVPIAQSNNFWKSALIWTSAHWTFGNRQPKVNHRTCCHVHKVGIEEFIIGADPKEGCRMVPSWRQPNMVGVEIRKLWHPKSPIMQNTRREKWERPLNLEFRLLLKDNKLRKKIFM